MTIHVFSTFVRHNSVAMTSDVGKSATETINNILCTNFLSYTDIPPMRLKMAPCARGPHSRTSISITWPQPAATPCLAVYAPSPATGSQANGVA